MTTLQPLLQWFSEKQPSLRKTNKPREINKSISFRHEQDIKDDEIRSETSQNSGFLPEDNVCNTAQKTDDTTLIELTKILCETVINTVDIAYTVK